MEPASDPQKQVSPVKVSLKWGAVTGIVLILHGMILHFAGATGEQGGLQLMLQCIILGAGIFLSAREHRDKQLEGYITYGRALGTGVLVCLFAAILSSLFTFIFYTASPDSLEEARVQAEQRVYEQGLPQDQEEMQLKMINKMMTPAGMLLSIIPSITFLGLILSLIIAAFVKKNRPLFMDE